MIGKKLKSVALFFAFIGLTLPPSAYAATYVVTTAIDENDGSCADGDCSLRDAILLANTSVDPDIITFDADYTITLTRSGTGDKNGDLDIKADLTIQGRGESATVINGNALDRVLDISGNADVVLQDLTITGGYTNKVVIGTNNVYGGGIWIHGSSSTSPTLTATGVTIEGNLSDHDGGGLYCKNALINLDRVSFLSNSNIRANGGGLWISDCDGSTVTRSLFQGNAASSDGGGLYILRSENITVSHSLLSGNTAGTHGGGVTVEPFTPPGSTSSLSIDNSTLTGNTAQLGGGIYLVYDSIINLHSVTIAANESLDVEIAGGGIFNSGANSTVNVKNSIVAANISAVAGNIDCNNNGSGDNASYFNSYGFNAIDDATCNYTSLATDVITDSASLRLEGLGDNGGETQTLMILPDSTAINTGDCTDFNGGGTLTDDQRGEPRDALCDIGAVETIPQWYPDIDGDGFGDASAQPIITPQAPEGHTLDHADCNDANASIHPNAEEICDQVDNNCNGAVDENTPLGCDETPEEPEPEPVPEPIEPEPEFSWYPDADGDAFGEDQAFPVISVQAPYGHVDNNADCNDADPYIYPGAEEICDGRDNNCNGAIDEGIAYGTYYLDEDGDSFGDKNATTNACEPPPGYVEDQTDCDDANADIHPHAEDLCDGEDNDCDGIIDGDSAYVCNGSEEEPSSEPAEDDLDEPAQTDEEIPEEDGDLVEEATDEPDTAEDSDTLESDPPSEGGANVTGPSNDRPTGLPADPEDASSEGGSAGTQDSSGGLQLQGGFAQGCSLEPSSPSPGMSGGGLMALAFLTLAAFRRQQQAAGSPAAISP